MQIIFFIVFLIIIFLIVFFFTNNTIQPFTDIKYQYGIVLCCYNRPEFLKKTLISLSISNLENTIICIIDDYSQNKETISLIRNYNIPGVKIIKKRNSRNYGVSKSLLDGFETLYPLCKYLTNIDSDVIMKRDWLDKLKYTYEEVSKLKSKLNARDFVITGFNCKNCMHPIIKTYPNLYLKKSIGGVNMFFNRKLFIPLFSKVLKSSNKNHGWDWSIVRIGKKLDIVMITTRPSVIQHIGFSGLNSSSRRYDIAKDF